MLKKLNVLAWLIMLLSMRCAYFNTYYNAEQYFKQAVKEYNSQPEGAALSANLRKKLDAVIEKTNNLEAQYPTSRWVENALYLNARATYYKGDYNIARRKFEEFFTRYPQSKLESEALIWYGRTLWKLNEREDAFFQWNRALRKLRDEVLLAELYQSIADLYANTKQLDSAITYYQKVTRHSPNLDVAAEAQYKIAELYLKKNEPQKAVQNLKKVSEFLPSQALKNKIQLLLTKIYRQAGQYEEAADLINERLNDQANEAIWGDLELQLGMLYLDKGDYESAVSRLENITQRYKGKPVAAEAYYCLAQLNITVFRNYERAQSQFENVIKENAKSPFANDARFRSAEIKRFIGIKKRLDALKKQVAELEKAKSLTPDTTLAKLANSADPQEVKKAIEKRAVQKKGVDTAAVYADYYNNLFEMGECFYFNFGEIDSALYYYRQLASSTYLNPVRDKALFCQYRILNDKQDASADSVKNALLSAYPYSPFTANLLGVAALLNADEQQAQQLFEQAEALREQNIDSALYYYEQIFSKYPTTPASEKSTMNLAFIYHHRLYNLDKALEWYQKFIENYPKSSYISQFRATYEQLKRIKNELDNQNTTSKTETSSVSQETMEPLPAAEPERDEK